MVGRNLHAVLDDMTRTCWDLEVLIVILPTWKSIKLQSASGARILEELSRNPGLRTPGLSEFFQLHEIVNSLYLSPRQVELAGFPDGSVVKNLPAMQETQVQSLSQEDPLEEEMATHFSILAWRIPWTEEPGRVQPMVSQELDTT